MNVTLGIASDLYQAGFRDDGHPFIAEAFFVTAEADDGRRWRYCKTFAGCRVSRDHETGEPIFIDTRDEASAECQRIVSVYQHVNIAGLERSYRWHEDRPAYGSDAYVRNGQSFEDCMQERAQEGALL